MNYFIKATTLFLAFTIVSSVVFFNTTGLDLVVAQPNVVQVADKPLLTQKPNIIEIDPDKVTGKVNTGNNTMETFECKDPGGVCQCTGGEYSPDCQAIKPFCKERMQCGGDGTCICIRGSTLQTHQ